MRRILRARWPLLVVFGAMVAGLVLLTPLGDGLMAHQSVAPHDLRPVRAGAAQPEVSPREPPLNMSFLTGPWRCTDQRTGVSAYWSYAANGRLIFHGDVLSDSPPPRAVAAAAPSEWVLDDHRLQHRYAQRGPDTFKVAGLTLARLRYGDERGMEVECRRP